MAVNITDADVKELIELVELAEASGTDSITIQEVAGTLKYITITNLKKTFIPNSGATVNADLGSVDLTTLGDITAANLVYLTDIIDDLTTGGATDVLSAQQGVAIKVITDALTAAIALNTTHRGLVAGNPHAVTQTEVGLPNVNNTSDANKPVSTAQQAALDLKESIANVDILKGAGWVAETVKGNADDIADLETDQAIMQGVGWTTENLVDHEVRIGIVETDLGTAEDATAELTQIVASKDQANLAEHNGMRKRLGVVEAETYNGTDITNESPTNKTGDGDTDISSVIVDGSAKVRVLGKSYENALPPFIETGAGKDSDYTYQNTTGESIASGIQTFTATAQFGRVRIVLPYNVSETWYYFAEIVASASGIYFQIGDGVSDTNAQTTGTGTTEKLSILKTLDGSATNHQVEIFDGRVGGWDAITVKWFAVNLTALGLDATLTTTDLCDAYFNYISGLQSTLPCDVVSSDINVFDKTKVTRGYKLDTDGTLTVSALDYTSDYMIIRPSEQWVGQDEEYAFFDSNFVFISYGTGAGAITAPATAFYERISSALTTLDTMQIEQSASATTYQAYNVNIAHEPVTLPQVPSARNTFNFDTGVLGVNVSPTAVFGADTGLTPSGQSSAYANVDLYFIVFADGGYHATLPYLELYGSHAWTWVGSTATTDFTDDMVNPYEFVTLGTANVFYVKIAKGANISVAKALLNGEKYFYELADASKYTVAYPPQTLIAWKGGEMSRIPMHRNSLVAVDDDVTVDHPISRVEAVYEYSGSEEIKVDPDDVSLDATGLIVTITGAASGEVYYVVAPYLTSGSTYGTQVASFTANNTASKVAHDIKAVTVVNVATYDTVITDNVLLVSYTATAAMTSLTLTSAMAEQTGRIITIKDSGNNANTNNITIDTEAAGTIDGAATLVMNVDLQTVRLITDGTDWHVL